MIRCSTSFWVTAGLLLVVAGCDFERGKKLTYAGTINTEQSIADAQDFVYGAYQFGTAFQVPPGGIKASFATHVSRTQVTTLPRTLTWTIVQTDQQGTPRTSYQIPFMLKMHPAGGGYAVTYLAKEKSIPAFTLQQYDLFQMHLQPQGGTLPTGLKLGVKLAYQF